MQFDADYFDLSRAFCVKTVVSPYGNSLLVLLAASNHLAASREKRSSPKEALFGLSVVLRLH